MLAAYTYDTAGRISNISFANGISTSYSYDTERNLAAMETRDRNGSVLLSYSYQYDRNGNRTGKKDLKNGNATAYVYDTMQRLSEVTYPETGKETYRYDEAGNRIQKQTQSYVEDYLYDERNRLTQKSVKTNTINSPTNPDSSGRDITTYEYDLQGSLIKEQSADFCKQYLYNDFHQCIQADVIKGREEAAERLVQENLYDGEGLRFAIIENGNRTGFITDGWDNVTELDGNGRVRKRIIRGLGIVASEDTEQKEDNIFTTAYHYYHGNERMDVEYITDEAGNVRNSYAYDAFGSIVNSSETIQNRYTYNGESYDKTTEQYYLRKRYYNPKLCRFTQEDEYRGDGLNLYAFCANNPVMYVDPSGYDSTPGTLFGEKGTEVGTSSSQNLGANILENVGIPSSGVSTGSHQAQHLIPQQVYRDSQFLQDIGFNVDHQQNGIYDVNRNNTSTCLNDLFIDNNVSDSMTNRYVSENTHHNGRHALYNNAVDPKVADIEYSMQDYKDSLIAAGYSEPDATAMWRSESRRQVHDLVETLRVMNQDGIDLYKSRFDNENQYIDQLEYDEYFNRKMEEAEMKRNSKCAK